MKENKIPEEQHPAKNADEACDFEEKKTAPLKNNEGSLPSKTLYMIIGGAAALVVLAVVLIILLIPKGESPNNNPIHTHSFGEWETVTEATCGNNGEMKRSCGCGEIETKEIPATGAHILSGWEVDKAPTEDSDGIIYENCENCDERVNEKIIPYIKADQYNYYVNSDGITCTLRGFKRDKEVSDPVIPSNLDGYIVTVIGSGAFYNDDITSVTIPDTVVSLDVRAFESCDYLKTVNLPNGLVEIGDGAFQSCKALESITIPASVVTVGYAFTSCESLKNVIFESGSKLQQIDVWGLLNYTAVNSVEIPDTVVFATGILPEFMHHPYPLTEYGNAYYIGNKNNPYHILVAAKSEDITSCNIHKDTKVIADEAFTFCDKLTSISFPDDCELRSIGWQTFADCEKLTQIHINGGVEYIGERAFMFCSKLENVYIGSTTKSIGTEAFWYCGKLKSIEIPVGVTEIGKAAFQYCENLETVTFAEGCRLEYIGESAFEECENLKEMDIPKGVSYIGQYAFRSCESMTKLTLPDNVIEYYRSTFNGCKKLKEIIIPEGVISLGDYCFNSCDEVQDLYLPISLTVFGEKVFDCPDNVYYAGSEEEWNALLANALSSSVFTNTTFHFNYKK